MHTTNYRSTLIAVAPDTKAKQASVPAKVGTVAALQYSLLAAAPYTLTSDDLIFLVHCERQGINSNEAEKLKFFSDPQACLRGSPLAKTYGFGLHHDEYERVALVPMQSDRYATLLTQKGIKVVNAMRKSRA
jgi:Family of unknown function (DUF6157)